MAAELLRESGIAVTDQSVRQGVAAARWPGRLELLPGNPPVLLDGAHNPAGAVALRESLMDFPCRRLVMVIGVMADKAWPDIVRTLLPAAAIVIAVRPALDRALPPEVLAEFCRDNGGDAVVAVNVAAGLDSAKTMAGNSDLVLVTGSLFTVGEARAYLAGGEFAPIRG
jgi:dihydrofolate synthase/folylpolyglutamate synthase